LTLPDWLLSFQQNYQPTTSSAEQMDFVIAAAAENVKQQTGGPFAAGVFGMDNGELIALGVNLVTRAGLSIAHAEIVALSLAQQKLDTYDLSAEGQGLSLVTSTEPCAMCLGAIPWSGVRQLTTAARDADARAIGFDEGSKPDNWPQTLEQRGINVIADVRRAEASAVLQQYVQQGGAIYNAGE
jgi:tRNA(Arg) A34 adenosine deaminase TadA